MLHGIEDVTIGEIDRRNAEAGADAVAVSGGDGVTMMNPGGLGGFGRQPAQRETISGGYEGGVKIPVIQAFASVVFASLCILFAWILLFVIGPDVLWCAGFAAIAVITLRVLRWVGTAQQETQEEINGVRAMTIGTCAIAVLLLVAWAASRQFCVDMWPAMLPTVSVWRVIFAVTFIIPPIAVCALMALSFAINAYNPASFQPMMAKPSGTPWWSPTGQTIVETEPEEPYQQIIQAIREIPRPVPAYGNGNPNPNGSAVQKRLTDASERQHATPPEPANDRFVAPGGRTVRVADLNEFVLDGVVVGATFKTWHKRKGWGEEYWRAMAETCAQHGIVKSPGPRSRTRFVVKSRREAAQALDHLWRHVFPPPHRPAPQSVGGNNWADARQTDRIQATEQN
jgi:hypothetical protein